MADPVQPPSSPSNSPSNAPAEEMEVMGAPSPLEMALQENTKAIVGAIIAIFIIIAGAMIFFGNKDAAQLAAAEDFTAAKTIEELEKVTADHPGTLGAGNALIATANLLASGSEAKPDEAIAKLEKFLDEYPDHPLRPQAMFAIGMQQQAAGKGAEAKAVFEQIVSDQPDSAVAPGALMRLGDLAWDEGDKAAARIFYEQIASQQYAGNEFITRTDERLRRLDEPAPSPPSERQRELQAKEDAEKAEREAKVKDAQEAAKMRAEEAAMKAAEAMEAEKETDEAVDAVEEAGDAMEEATEIPEAPSEEIPANESE